jgi:hypothetical protein
VESLGNIETSHSLLKPRRGGEIGGELFVYACFFIKNKPLPHFIPKISLKIVVKVL